ncbi:MAG: flagellar hook-length control protein FliK [Phycisphaerales bacterium]
MATQAAQLRSVDAAPSSAFAARGRSLSGPEGDFRAALDNLDRAEDRAVDRKGDDEAIEAQEKVPGDEAETAGTVETAEGEPRAETKADGADDRSIATNNPQRGDGDAPAEAASLTVAAAAAPLTITALNRLLLRIDPTLAARGLIRGVQAKGGTDGSLNAPGESEGAGPKVVDRALDVRPRRDAAAATLEGGRQNLRNPPTPEGESDTGSDPLFGSNVAQTDQEGSETGAASPTVAEDSAATPSTAVTAATAEARPRTALPLLDRLTERLTDRLTGPRSPFAVRAVAVGTRAGFQESNQQPGFGPQGQRASTAPSVPNAQAGAATSAPSAEQFEAQVARGAAALLERGGGNQEITLRLNPESLGELRIHLSIDGERVRLRFAAETPEARGLLQSTWSSIADALSEKGLLLDEERSGVEHLDRVSTFGAAERPENAGGDPRTGWENGSESREESDGDGPPTTNDGRRPGSPSSEDPPRVWDSVGRMAVTLEGLFLRVDAIA